MFVFFTLGDLKPGPPIPSKSKDMMPKDFAQLERFVSHADDARVMKRLAKKKRRRLTSGERNFGAGEPWTGGVVNYCFQDASAASAERRHTWRVAESASRI